MAAESSSLAIVQRMNRNIVGTFFNMLNKISTENTLTDTPWNIFKVDESGIKINNKPGAVIKEKGSKNVHVLTSGGKI
jgi:hypothetical protein